MTGTNHAVVSRPEGICLRGAVDEAILFMERLNTLGLASEILQHRHSSTGEAVFRLSDAAALRLTPGLDTTELATRLHLDLESSLSRARRALGSDLLGQQ